MAISSRINTFKYRAMGAIQLMNFTPTAENICLGEGNCLGSKITLLVFCATLYRQFCFHVIKAVSLSIPICTYVKPSDGFIYLYLWTDYP